jgi:crossover junction endodeoxyribonuclease RuvC
MPTERYGKANVASFDGLRYAVGTIAPRLAIGVIEHVHSMPRQGVASSFSFGFSTSVCHAVVALYCAEKVTVTPQVWKKHHGLKGNNKRHSLDLASRLWPRNNVWGVLANDGVAEAALMARYVFDT